LSFSILISKDSPNSLKILLVLGRYLPFKNAGIENYTHTLVRKLIENKFAVQVAVLESESVKSYLYENVQVIPLKNGYISFSRLLENEDFDICHFQEYSGPNGINLKWFQTAKTYCSKVFFTFHLPYLTCYKNDFRYNGIEDCDNFSSSSRCVKCIIATKLNFQKSNFSIRNFSINLVTQLVQKSPKINGLNDRIGQRKEELKQLIEICNNIFIYADWFKKLLNRNGYTSSAIVKIPYVTNQAYTITFPETSGTKNKILFVGRIEKQKGLFLLCKAMNLIKENLELDVFGNVVDEAYNEKCRSEYAYNFKGTLPLKDLLKELDQYDFLVMPSVFTEMYSMMIKDAFNYKLPVIASSAKGNADVIKEGKNGFIFNYGDDKDLAKVIEYAYDLKQKGWKPQFETNSSPVNDWKQILSYYKRDSIVSEK
jgi:glycosyltransferase involved in cell wall biosynthesis